MSQAQSLLNSLAARSSLSDTNVSTSPIHDYLVIDAEGRIINVPATEILFGVETDLDSDRKYFQCPRYVGDNLDLTTLGLRIHYRNALGKKDGYIVDDVKVSGEWIIFSWSLGGKLFEAKGTVNFAICAVSVDDEGYETCKWNTTLASGTVLEGLDVDLTSSEYYEASDLLQQLLSLLNTRSNEAVQAVTNEGTKQIGNVETAGTEQRTLIESKGAETLATIPDDYTATYNAADDALRKKACAILIKEEGEIISVSDASDDYVRGLKVFGKTEQKTYTGKNLFDNKASSVTTLGITFTVHEDKSVTANGTATDNIYFSLGTYSLEPGDYKISGCTGGEIDTYLMYTQKEDSSGYVYTIDGEKTITISDTDERKLLIAIYKGVTVSNLNFYPMISVEGGDYEPYTGGKASPNPEYPQELDSVENLKVKIFSKNFIQNTLGTTTIGNMTYTLNDDGSITINGTTTGETYYMFDFHNEIPVRNTDLKVSYEGNNGLTTLVVGYFDKDGNAVNSIASVNNKESTFQYPENAAETRIFIAVSANTTLDNLVVRPMIRLADNNSTFDYKEVQSLTVSQSLPGLPVSSGGNYTDSNGQQWICDEIDFERGVLIEKTRLRNLSEVTWTQGNVNKLGTGTIYYVFHSYLGAPSGSSCMLTHFKAREGDHAGISWETLAVGEYVMNDYLVVCTEHGSLDEFSAWLIESGAIGLFVRNTPIETPLTADELNAFRALHTNYPNTVVLNDNGATMRLLYNADTKTFVIQNGGGGSGVTVSKISVTLSASKWTASSDGTYYTQSTGITVDDNVKVDLQPTAAQLIELLNGGISMFLSNEDGYVIAYAVGDAPTTDMTIQATKTAVIYV